MNTTQKVIISLIQSAIDPAPIHLPNADINWKQVFQLCKKAQITAIVFEALEQNHCKIPQEIHALFQQSALSQVAIDQQQTYHLERLIERFNDKKIDFTLLKGASLKNLYPSRYYRSMSDIDILIKIEQYDQIKEEMMQLSYDQGQETDHELMWYNAPYIHIELHKRLIPSYNQDFFAYYGDGWQKMKLHLEHQYEMSPEDELIYLLTHFSKHYRDGGIGIKHVVDFWVFKRYYRNLNEKYILKELKRLHLDKFYRNLLDTIDVWFHGKAETNISEMITNTVFQSGAYGSNDRWDSSYALRITKEHSNTFTAKLSNLFHLIFMPLSLMQKKYPILHKLPFLLPVFWIVRWVDALLFKRRNIKRQHERAKHISEDTIEQYQAELNAVGLDYYF